MSGSTRGATYLAREQQERELEAPVVQVRLPLADRLSNEERLAIACFRMELREMEA